MRRPLLLVTLFYGAGILAADQLPADPLVFLLLGACLALILLALAWPRGRSILIWALLPLVGAANLSRQKAALSPSDLRLLIGDRPEIVSLRGRLCETPFARPFESKGAPRIRTQARLEVDAIRSKNEDWQPARGEVLVLTDGRLPENYFAGQTAEATGVLRLPRGPATEGGFDYRAYLARHGIYFQLFVSGTNEWRHAQARDEQATPPLPDRFAAWARATLARGLPVEDESLQLLWTMTLGWKTALSGDVSEPFMRSGTMHVFAISGLHIALIAGLLLAVLRVFRVPRARSGLIVIPLIWAYTGLTGWQASAIRSTLMMSVIVGGWAARRPSDLLNSLGGAAGLILLWDPQQLFQASFQLSFCVVLGLALLAPVLEQVRRRWLAPDPFLPRKLKPSWHRWVQPPADFLTTGLATSLAAWLGSIPLIAYYFHLFTPISLLSNLVVVPLSSAALAANLSSLFAGALFPGVSELCNHAGWFFMLLMIRVSEWSAQVPAGCVNIATPAPGTLLLYYLSLVALMKGWLIQPGSRRWIAAGLSSLALLWFGSWTQARVNSCLHILPLPGGAAIYYQPARGQPDLLIDPGNKSSAEFLLKPFLRAQGINRLDRLLLTHGDINHVGGAQVIAGNFPTRAVFTSAIPFRSRAYREQLEYFKSQPAGITTLGRNDRLGPWQVLHPDKRDRFSQADDNSLVLLGQIEGWRVLLLSELGKPGQDIFMRRYPGLEVDLVVGGVPARGEPLADALLAQLRPQLIILTDSENPSSHRASRALRQRLSSHHAPVLFTANTGALRLTLGTSFWEVQGLNGSRFSSAEGETH